MKHSSILVGIAASAALLLVLAVTRLFVVRVESAELEIREIAIATLPEPPPPPPEEPPPDAPPPPPSVRTVEMIPDPTRVPVPKAEIPMSLETPVTTFFTDLDPAPLPQPAQTSHRPPDRPTQRPSTRPPTPPPPRVKSHYSASELDGKPQLLRHGSTPFPVSLSRRGVTRGTVTLEVELSERGTVKVRRVVSSTHPELVAGARRVAAGARFTSPTRHGHPVKSIMRWPIVIKK